jgi:hypothetical protein
VITVLPSTIGTDRAARPAAKHPPTLTLRPGDLVQYRKTIPDCSTRDRVGRSPLSISFCLLIEEHTPLADAEPAVSG